MTRSTSFQVYLAPRLNYFPITQKCRKKYIFRISNNRAKRSSRSPSLNVERSRPADDNAISLIDVYARLAFTCATLSRYFCNINSPLTDHVYLATPDISTPRHENPSPEIRKSTSGAERFEREEALSWSQTFNSYYTFKKVTNRVTRVPRM